jgi:hypothetical protein
MAEMHISKSKSKACLARGIKRGPRVNESRNVRNFSFFLTSSARIGVRSVLYRNCKRDNGKLNPSGRYYLLIKTGQIDAAAGDEGEIALGHGCTLEIPPAWDNAHL